MSLEKPNEVANNPVVSGQLYNIVLERIKRRKSRKRMTCTQMHKEESRTTNRLLVSKEQKTHRKRVCQASYSLRFTTINNVLWATANFLWNSLAWKYNRLSFLWPDPSKKLFPDEVHLGINTRAWECHVPRDSSLLAFKSGLNVLSVCASFCRNFRSKKRNKPRIKFLLAFNVVHSDCPHDRHSLEVSCTF